MKQYLRERRAETGAQIISVEKMQSNKNFILFQLLFMNSKLIF